MDMRVDKTWREKFSARVKNFFAVIFSRAHADNLPVINRDLAQSNLAAQDVDYPTIFYNEVGFASARRRLNQIFKLRFRHKQYSFKDK